MFFDGLSYQSLVFFIFFWVMGWEIKGFFEMYSMKMITGKIDTPSYTNKQHSNKQFLNKQYSKLQQNLPIISTCKF
jgi:hypothetical protein